MKKVLSIILAILAICMTGCRENFTELDKGSTPLALTADKDTLYLDQSEYSRNGLTLNWTSGTNEGTGHRIYYRLELTRFGMGFEDAFIVANGITETFSKVWTVDEINQLVLDQFAAVAGEKIALTARITASGEGFATQEAECDFVIVPYVPVTKSLYIIGNATSGSWTLADATPLEMKEIGYFKTTLRLKKGSFKFIISTDGMLPGYMPGETDEDVVLRSEQSQPDKMWKVAVDHLYEITVNLITMKMTMKEVAALRPDFDDIYLIGDETAWNFWQLQRDPLDPFLFRMGHLWTIGKEFKFGTASGSWENNYKATQAGASFTTETMQFVKGFEPDNKWMLGADECDKMYKICVDIHTAQERMIMREFVPYAEMYLVGDAVPVADDPIAMTVVDDSIFTWTGDLSVGDLQFACGATSDNTVWLMPTADAKEPMGVAEPILFVDKSEESLTRYQYAQSEEVDVDEIDMKWHIAEAGQYTIVLDQLHEKVTIAKAE